MTERDPRQVRQELAEFTRAVEPPVKTIEIPLVRDVTVAVRPHTLEDTWEVYDVESGEVVDTVEVEGGEDEALEAAWANAVDYLKDDAKHVG